MNEAEKRRLGEDLEPGYRPTAPEGLHLVQKFINSWNHEFSTEWDRLGTPEKAKAWLVRWGLLQPDATLTESERVRLVRLRESLHALADVNRDGAALGDGDLIVLVREGEAVSRFSFDRHGGMTLEPTGSGVDGSIARLLTIVFEAQMAETFGRLKSCRQCGWAFYDRSKNRSGSWCAMSICGNRKKNRTYRRRKASDKSARRM
ncbi:MAG TPA: CGNR zinc finger domain-containing protein [Actinomycetota bacterium]|jgi:predicted RNA-binding Zn ribbon-like protein|nr:CGNR zinc finger domain-containing protein [Actinomycetota bacterium]